MRHTAYTLSSIVLMSLVLVMSGCDDLEPTSSESDAVQQAVQGYLDSLAKAYSSLYANALAGHATGAEMASVVK